MDMQYTAKGMGKMVRDSTTGLQYCSPSTLTLETFPDTAENVEFMKGHDPTCKLTEPIFT